MNLSLRASGLFYAVLITVGLLLFISVEAALPKASDQFLQSLSRSSENFAAPGDAHTLQFQERIAGNPWIQELNDNIINGDSVPPALREKGQMMLDQVTELDQRCAATPGGPARDACEQQRDAAVSQIEKMVADNNPDVALLLSPAAREAGDFSSEFDLSNLVKAFDSVTAQMGNLTDMLGDLSALPMTETKQALETPLPAPPSFNIEQYLGGDDNLEHKRLATAEQRPVSDEPSEGFFDSIQNFWERLKPGVEQALIMQAVAQGPAFSTLGQSGQGALRVISLNRDTDAFASQSKAINEERDRRVTRHNDIGGQGLSAINERVTQNMEVLNEISQQQDQTLQSLQHICQHQRASVPCWETGNEIPFDLLALLMGLGGGGGSAEANVVELEPYTAWVHCPLPDQPFTITSEGNSFSALLIDESTRLVLTVASALPSTLHPEGCIIGLQSEEGMQYLQATVKPDTNNTSETTTVADLALLEIQQVHQELGEDLADPNIAYDDFINEYWPEHLVNACDQDSVFRIGDELNLFGFEVLDSESEGPEEVVVLNGLANFVAEANGATRFTTNGEESFTGGLVARTETGCFKGLALIEVEEEEESNVQSLIPIELIQSWLSEREINLPASKNNQSDR